METKVCNECKRELPIENFKKTRWGHTVSICSECLKKRRAVNKKTKKLVIEIFLCLNLLLVSLWRNYPVEVIKVNLSTFELKK